MDVSELCINEDAGDSASSTEPSFLNRESNSLPYMTESLRQNSGGSSSSSRNDVAMIENIYNSQSAVYHGNPQLAYQQRYIQQHKNLKSYSLHNRNHQHEDHPYYYQQDQQQQNGQEEQQQQQQQHQQQEQSSLPQQQQQQQPRHLPRFNSHTTPSLTNTNIRNDTNTLPPISSPSPSVEEPNNHTNNNNSNQLLSQLLEQCSMVYSRIGKYRVDPLSESERSHIIDQVYFTAEKMLRSIRQLHSNNVQHAPRQRQRQQQEEHIMEMDDSVGTPTNGTPAMSLDDNDENGNIPINDQSDEYKMIRQARNLQNNNSRPKYRRRSKRSMQGMRCHSCGTSSTPEWRRGPDGARTLCNACGLHYSKLIRKGSMTVQTHNYLLESPPEFKRAPRIIQFPIIQVNGTTNTATTSLPSSASPQQQTHITTTTTTATTTTTSSSTSSPNNGRTGNHRIVELHPDDTSYQDKDKIYCHDEDMNSNSNDVG